MTVVLTDEDLAWAARCCTRVVEIEGGRMVGDYPLVYAESRATAPAEHFTPFKVPARREDRILLYNPGDILYATSRESKTYLRTVDEEAVTGFTLQELEQCLSGRGFFAPTWSTSSTSGPSSSTRATASCCSSTTGRRQ